MDFPVPVIEVFSKLATKRKTFSSCLQWLRDFFKPYEEMINNNV